MSMLHKVTAVGLSILLSLVLCLNSAHADSESETTAVLTTAQLIEALQSGGHIIYMRHSITDHEQRDSNRNNINDCGNQRNLSAEGIKLAKLIGDKFQSLAIPVGTVVSSPYCRCKDTAELVFGHVEINNDLRFSMSKDQHEMEMLAKKLHQMMLSSDSKKGNTVFVGHSSNLRDGLGIWPKPEGVVVIFKKVDNVIKFKGMIKPDEWTNI